MAGEVGLEPTGPFGLLVNSQLAYHSLHTPSKLLTTMWASHFVFFFELAQRVAQILCFSKQGFDLFLLQLLVRAAHVRFKLILNALKLVLEDFFESTNHSASQLAPAPGLEPGTHELTARCSTD